MDALDARASRSMRCRTRAAVEDAAGDLAAVGHLAQRRRLDGRGDLGRHGLDRRQDGDARVPNPIRVNRSIAFWMMSRLASRSGKMLIAASVMNSVRNGSARP